MQTEFPQSGMDNHPINCLYYIRNNGGPSTEP